MNDWYNGFKKDCLSLLSSFVAKRSTDFSHFSAEWKKHNFQYVFYGHASDIELVQHIEECFHIIKTIFLESVDSLERIGVLYLFYAMYYKQPPKEYCKMRVTELEWNEFRVFYELNHSNKMFDQFKLIFWKLLYSDAYCFVRSVKDYGLDGENQITTNREAEDILYPFQTKNFNTLIKSQINVLTDCSTGLLPALDILQCGYNEMKEMLDTTPSTSTSKALPTSDIVSKLQIGLKKISKIFEKECDLDTIRNIGDEAWKKKKLTRQEIKRKAMAGGKMRKSKSEIVQNKLMESPKKPKIYGGKKNTDLIKLSNDEDSILAEFINATEEKPSSKQPLKNLDVIE